MRTLVLWFNEDNARKQASGKPWKGNWKRHVRILSKDMDPVEALHWAHANARPGEIVLNTVTVED